MNIHLRGLLAAVFGVASVLAVPLLSGCTVDADDDDLVVVPDNKPDVEVKPPDVNVTEVKPPDVVVTPPSTTTTTTTGQ